MNAVQPQPLVDPDAPSAISLIDTTKRPSLTPKIAKRPLTPPQAIKLRDVDIVVVEERCKGCSFCIEFCPKDALEEDAKLNIRGVHAPRVDSALCVGCGVCEEICPDFAIFLVDKRENR